MTVMPAGGWHHHLFTGRGRPFDPNWSPTAPSIESVAAPSRRPGRDVLPTPPEWMKDAACQEHPEIDFLGPKRVAALAVCASCLVRSECLTFALEKDMRDGVWGGLTRGQRMKLGRPVPTTSVVYFATDREMSFIKIGCSARVDKRLRDLALRPLAMEPGSYQRETELHKRFAHLCIHGERFRPGPDLLAYIEALTTDDEAAA